MKEIQYYQHCADNFIQARQSEICFACIHILSNLQKPFVRKPGKN